MDNCLCDACFRHVDRRANCPSYKKRLSAPAGMGGDDIQQNGTAANDSALYQQNKEKRFCKVIDCKELETSYIRRKLAIKMRKSIGRIIQVNFELTSNTATTIPFCEKHYEAISHLMVCALCKRCLTVNFYYVNQVCRNIIGDCVVATQLFHL